MPYISLILVILFVSVPAWAQEITVEAACSLISRQQVQGAAYKQAVDVEGKPVKPADLEGAAQGIIYPLVVPVEIDALKLLDLDVPAKFDEAGTLETDVGYVTLHKDGRVEYNGQDISEKANFECVNVDGEVILPPSPPQLKDPPPQEPKKTKPAVKKDVKAENKEGPKPKPPEEKPPEPSPAGTFKKDFKTLINQVTSDEIKTDE